MLNKDAEAKNNTSATFGISGCITRNLEKPTHCTYDSVCERQVVEIEVDLDIGVDLGDGDVDILAQDLFDLVLDQPHPLASQTHRGALHLRVDVVQVLGDCLGHNLGIF